MSEWRDKETLVELYKNKGMSTLEIGDKLGCSDTTVQNWLGEHGIEKENKPGSEHKQRPWKDKERLRENYREKRLKCSEIADKWNTTTKTIARWLDRHGIEKRSAAPRSGSEHPRYKNRANFYHIKGYEMWQSYYDRSADFVLVHRLVAVAEYGFESVCGNVIHHKNGIPWDNRHENLEIMSAEDHSRLHRLKKLGRAD